MGVYPNSHGNRFIAGMIIALMYIYILHCMADYGGGIGMIIALIV